MLAALLPSPRRLRTRPVRICFVIDRLSRAGTETQLLALIRSLDRSRVEPHLCLLDGQDELSRSLEPEACPILRLGVRALLRPAVLWACRQLVKFWRRHRIDIVQTYFLDSTYFGALLARLCGIRRIIRVRNNLGYWVTGTHQRLNRWMGKLVDVTLTNSDNGRDAVIEMDHLPADRVTVLENGVDLERFPKTRPPELTGPVVRVGAVANLRPVKNMDGLIRVAAQLRDRRPQLQFSVAGDGEQRADLERLIGELGLRDRFVLRGSVSDIPSYLAEQDIAVLGSHSEGMSNALLEYMAAGRAIIATDVGANARLVKHGESGLIVPPGELPAMATALEQLLDYPDQSLTMAENARHRVETDYSREAMVRRFESFYEQLLR